jgi:hypothetical protein
MSDFDPVCLIHGKRWSEHALGRCLYCCLCYRALEPEECWADEDGQKWDICESCGKLEVLAKAER